jgi:hypothetical protein
MVNSLMQAAAEGGETVNHWIIGAVTLVALLLALIVLLAFAGGREHS